MPVCFAYDGQYLYIPVDRKEKSVAPGGLKRVRNIMSNPQVSLVDGIRRTLEWYRAHNWL